jgi:hypothetical protein
MAGVFPPHPATSTSGAGSQIADIAGVPWEKIEVRRYLWGTLAAVAVLLTIGGFIYGSGKTTSDSFLLTDWISRPNMVSQCMIGLDRAPNPQDQDVWKAMGIKDPTTLPYFGRLRYCYEGFWAWQRALQPRSG